MRYILILSILLVSLNARVINFSPLPMDKAPKLFTQYNFMLKYLEEQTGHKFNFIYSASYKELIKNFKEGKIDIIELGALPYVQLKKQFEDAYPFLTFNSKYGKPYYSCDLITTEKDINSFADIVHSNEVILTRSLSTCGYLMSEYIMKENGKSLNNFQYQYVGTHSNVLLKLLLEKNTIGTVKSTVLDKYSQFKFKTIAKSPNIPGFAFIANKNTIGSKEITAIENAILKLDPLHNEKDRSIVSKWGINTKFGAVKTDEKAYEIVTQSIQEIVIPKDKK